MPVDYVSEVLSFRNLFCGVSNKICCNRLEKPAIHSNIVQPVAKDFTIFHVQVQNFKPVINIIALQMHMH
jgi:hypothetical protein